MSGWIGRRRRRIASASRFDLRREVVRMQDQPTIETFRFGKIVIDGHAYNRDVIVLPDRVLPNWWRVEGHTLSYEDLQQAFADELDLLIVGTGIFNRMINFPAGFIKQG